ncbi:alpha/beta fold hydrolase [Vibrio mangrovi]|uniref:Alpha/beta hydrolase n=1 Tax=Vibrio mangrovi TaxID=474394 RepID=A0A1Y6IXW7_9VIBR|nr:alpha/beta hydrolase [Vibrio mangrovi]MDW6004908.1 alpha/beta hydrolase [Vibrio mangrovi]SMS01670.1 Haloalkane dehalogenase [Vibrio mangrovi]
MMKTHYIEKYQAVLRYHDIAGDKLPIVFIHGLGCSSSSDYPAVAASSLLSGHRCILVDLFGAGFSDAPETFSYSVRDHAQVLMELIDAMQLPRLVIFGHSAGGAIAIELASLCQERVASIVLAEPNLDPGGGFFSQTIACQSLSDFCEKGYQRKIQEATLTGNHIWAGTMQVAAPVAVHQLSQSLVTGSVPSWRELLIQFLMPKLVLFGEYSLPDEDLQRLPQAGVHVAVIPQAGHSMMWENPLTVAQEIADFIG